MILDKYDAYKASGIDWLAQIPSQWKVKRIKDIIYYIDQGWSPNAENRTVANDEWGVLKLSAVKNGIYYENEHKALSINTVPNHNFKVRENDILITRSNTPQLVGDSCIVKKNMYNLMYSDLIYKLKLQHSEYNARYLVYFLISAKNRFQIVCSARGLNTSMVKISQTAIRNWQCVFPRSINKQIRIANFLDKQTSSIDKRIELSDYKIKKYGELKEELINETVCRGLNKEVELKESNVDWIKLTPKNWKTARIKNIFDERVEKNLSDNGEPVTKNILSVLKDIGVINHRDKGNVGNKMAKDITGYKLVYPNDIVVNKMNVLIGSVGISREFGALSVVYIVLKTKLENSPRYYDYVFRSKYFQRYLRTIATGILEIREAVNMTLFGQQELPNPEYEEQEAIADYLDDKCSKIDKIIQKSKQQIDLLKEFRKTLISDVVTGKVRVNHE
ncbi:restriction endonuclease subunit S [Abyssisolibacter fermentans]|uniref:restriction endonuclease subunit S n=1 Tax=Abyssisolibacter fermentans TaxID=1766203 RepID=UPI0008308E75|nr:restriction endonuclease subunit S [Abyssisolibacter fermentans]